MRPLRAALRHYAWGSSTELPELLGVPGDGRPVAEAWFGAHPAGPSGLLSGPDGGPEGPRDLAALIDADPVAALGPDVLARFGAGLPYLLKVIAAERPLSLQVHPTKARAEAGFAAEEAAGVARDAPDRCYKDANHKPELVVALTRMEAMCGFRSPRRVLELVSGLAAPLAVGLAQILRADPTSAGIRTAFLSLLDPATRPSPTEVAAVAQACAARLTAGSPSPRADRTAVALARAYPGDPGVVVSLLLNPVTLQPGEAMFIPPGGVHAYLEGTGLEIMASSDNVLRAGLTDKHVDIPELLANVEYVAAPPVRIAPETVGVATRVYYAPVDDFELAITTPSGGVEALPGHGPRILLCLSGRVRVTSALDACDLGPGEAVFVAAAEGRIEVTGAGTLVQADVP